MKRIYQKLLKEGNGDHKFLRCSDICDNHFEVLSSEIALDKEDFECAGTVKDKPAGNDSGFITYSNTINSTSKWLDNSGYLITQLAKIGKIKGYHMVQKLGRTKKLIKVGKISEKYDILTLEKRNSPYCK